MSDLYSYVCARVREADLTETLAATTACGLPHDLTRRVLERAPAPYVELRLSVDQAHPQGYLRCITPGFITMLLAGASDVLQARLGGLHAINTSDFRPDLERALLAYCLLDREDLEDTPDDASEPWEGVTLSVWISASLLPDLRQVGTSAAWWPDDTFFERFPPPGASGRMRLICEDLPFSAGVSAVAMDPGGRWAVVVSEEGDAARYALRDGHREALREGLLGDVPCVAPHGDRVQIVALNGERCVFDPERMEVMESLPPPPFAHVSRVLVGAEGLLIFAIETTREDADWGEEAGCIAIPNGEILHQHRGLLRNACLARAAPIGASVDEVGDLAVWTPQATRWRRAWEGEVHDLALSADGLRLWILDGRGLHRVDVSTGEVDRSWALDARSGSRVLPLPDEQTLLVASGGYVHCLHIPSEEIIRQVRLREPADDARWLVAASADRLVLVYRQREVLLLEI